MAGRPKIFDLGVQSSVYLEHEHKKFIEQKGLSLSMLLRDLIEENMDKIDIYKEIQELRQELTQAKNDNIELLKELEIVKKTKKKEEKEEDEMYKLRLTESDKLILKNPSEFLKWLDLYDNFTISEQSFMSKVGMSTNRARKLKEEYL
jgi:galactitol-specific phosphotransferase system IIB component